MIIKQQKQIKAFLAESFGNDRGGKLFEMQDKALGEIIGNTKGKTENQMETLIQTILPRIVSLRWGFLMMMYTSICANICWR